MTAVAELPAASLAAPKVEPTIGQPASALALGYLGWASACWRGDALAPVFASRLAEYWRPSLPPAPTSEPDAVSPHGGGGRGIHWYQIGAEVLGYVPGGRGGYRVPVSAIARLIRCASVVPWTALPAKVHEPEQMRRVRPQEEAIGLRVLVPSG